MEITNNTAQTVAVSGNVLFTNVAIPGNCSIIYREGSGLVKLRGLTNSQCRARFKVTFSGNIAVPTGGTAGEISLALSADGETIAESTMISTPAAAAEYQNVSTTIYIDVPRNCCSSLTVKNIGDEEISVINANLIVERVA